MFQEQRKQHGKKQEEHKICSGASFFSHETTFEFVNAPNSPPVLRSHDTHSPVSHTQGRTVRQVAGAPPPNGFEMTFFCKTARCTKMALVRHFRLFRVEGSVAGDGNTHVAKL